MSLSVRVKHFTMHNPSVFHKREILELEDNYAHPKLGPMKHNQGALQC